MAKTFLNENDTFVVANSDSEIVGRAGGNETVEIQPGVSGLVLDGNIERVELAGAASSVELQVNSTSGRLEFVNGGEVVASFSAGLAGSVDVVFSDGNATLTQTGGTSYTLADPNDSADEATIDLNNAQAGDAVGLGGETGGVATDNFTIATSVERFESRTLPQTFSIDPESDPIDVGTVDVASATSEFNTVSDAIDRASNTDELDVNALLNWTVADTFANLDSASAVVLDNAESYSITEQALTAANVTGATVADLADEQAAARDAITGSSVFQGASNSGSVTVNDGTYTLADTLSNLEGAAGGVVSDAESYTLTDNSLTAAEVTGVTVAGLADAQAAAVKAVRDNTVVDGAENGDTIAINDGAYTLADTLSNLDGAKAGVVSGAASYTLTNNSLQAANVTDVTVAGLADAQTAAVQAVRDGSVVAGASNGATITVDNGTYTLEDSVENITEAADSVVSGAASYTLTTAVYSLADASVADATTERTDVQDTIDDAANGGSIKLADVFTWTLSDTLANLEAVESDAVFTGADSYTLSNDALTADPVNNVTVANLSGEQAAAVQAVRDNTVVDGATNGDTITIDNGTYTLADTLDNLTNADDGVVSGAASYELTNTDTNLGTLSQAEFNVAEGATNSGDYDFGTRGETFVLDTNVDILDGTANNDTFSANLDGGAQTLQSTDEVNGEGGVDRLVAQLEGAGTTTPTLSSVEELEIESTDNDNSILSVNDATGYTSIANTSSVNNLEVNGINSLDVDLEIQNVADQTTTFAYQNAVVAGTDDAATVTLNNVTNGNNTSIVDIDGIETLTINSSSNANAIDDVANIGALENLIITGAADFTIEQNIDDGVTSIDGSEATGDITLSSDEDAAVTISGGAGADSLTMIGGASVNESVAGGSGDDTITFDDELADTDSVDGGEGVDTLVAADADLDGLDTDNISGFETLESTDLDAALSTVDVQAGIETVDLNVLDGNTLTFEAGTRRLQLDGTAGNALTVSDTGDATTDVLTIANDSNTAIDIFDDEQVNVNGFETVTIDTGEEDATEQDTANLNLSPDGTDTALTVNFTGGNIADVEDITTTSSGLLTVDASGMTVDSDDDALLLNDISLGADGTANITGSGGIDEITVGDFASTISGGAGADDLNGGAESDSLVGEAGDDSLTAGDGDDSLVGGTGGDTLEGEAGDDSLVGDAGADSLVGGDGADSLTGGDDNDELEGDAGNDVLLGSAGDDQITTGTGDDSVDGGAGDDTVALGGNLGFADTIGGGADTDTLVSNSGVGTAGASRVTGFETLELDTDADQDMANFNDNAGFTRIDLNANSSFDSAIQNAGAAIAELRVDNAVTSVDFQLLDDTTSDSLSVGGFADADTTVGTLTVNDEETLTLVDGALADGDDTLTITDLAADDLETLNIATSADAVVDNAITGANDSLATIDASGATGTVDVDASNSTIDLTFTGASETANTITGGSGDDSYTGGTANDSLSGGAGADTFAGGDGDDTIAGGQGADEVDGGDGTDTFSAAGMDADNPEGTAVDPDGAVVNLGAALTQAEVSDATNGGISTSQTSVATNTAVYKYTDATTTGPDTVDSLTSIENVIGSDGLDYIIGSDAGNDLAGGDEADTIEGGAGADTIDGGDGNDVITGGAGADDLTGGNGADTFVFSALADNGTDDITDFDEDNGGTDDDVLNFSDNLGALFDDGAGGTEAFDNTSVANDADVVANDAGGGEDLVVNQTAVADLGAIDAALAGLTGASDDGQLYIGEVTDYDGQGTTGTVIAFDAAADTDNNGTDITLLGILELDGGGAALANLDQDNFA